MPLKSKKLDFKTAIYWCPYAIKTENLLYDGTGTPNWIIQRHPTTLFVKELTLQAGASDNIQTVARVFTNNGGDHENPANNTLIHNATLVATTAVDDAAVTLVTINLNFWLPARYRLNVLLGKTVVGGYYVAAFGGQYSEAVGDPELYR